MYTHDAAAQMYQYANSTEAVTAWVKINLEFPIDIWIVMAKFKSPEQTERNPKATVLKKSEDKEIKENVLNEKIKKYIYRVQEYEDNKSNVFKIVLGQCSDALRAKLRRQDN